MFDSYYPKDWEIHTWQSNQWVLDYNLPNPSLVLVLEEVSTIKVDDLIDGDIGFTLPVKKSIKSDIDFVWLQRKDYDNGLKSQLETYMMNGDKLRVVTPYNETYEGWISRVEAHHIPRGAYTTKRGKRHNLTITMIQDNTT